VKEACSLANRKKTLRVSGEKEEDYSHPMHCPPSQSGGKGWGGATGPSKEEKRGQRELSMLKGISKKRQGKRGRRRPADTIKVAFAAVKGWCPNEGEGGRHLEKMGSCQWGGFV